MGWSPGKCPQPYVTWFFMETSNNPCDDAFAKFSHSFSEKTAQFVFWTWSFSSPWSILSNFRPNRSYPRDFSAVWTFQPFLEHKWAVNGALMRKRQFQNDIRGLHETKSKKIFERPKNREDSSDFDDFWTKIIAATQSNFLIFFSNEQNKERNKRTNRTDEPKIALSR